MPFRTIDVGGQKWRVQASGRVTQLDRDEFGLVFVRGSGPSMEVRVSRYSPMATRSREAALAELSEDKLRELFTFSQPSDTSPDAGYRP